MTSKSFLVCILTLITSLPVSAQQQWTIIKGNGHAPSDCVYGTIGQFDQDNTPGARNGSATFNYNGNIYVFGGYRNDYRNDLWEYDLSLHEWRCIKGDVAITANGVYGTQGVAAAANRPSGRRNFASWLVGSKFYVFGGRGLNASTGILNDLWEYDFVTGNWRWLKGSSIAGSGSVAVFGTQGVGAAANTPEWREGTSGWSNNGNIYLFGGYNGADHRNDIWEYNPTTNFWTWIKGPTTGSSSGNWGTMNVAAATNNPPATSYGQSWWCAGKFYLYSGESAVGAYYLSALWEYNPSTNNWTWVQGTQTQNIAPVYGPMNTGAAPNTPGSRYDAFTWTNNNKLYLYGGHNTSDLWEYDPATGYWQWQKGDTVAGQAGIYTMKGFSSPLNKAGAKWGGASTVMNNSVYLFGGGSASLTQSTSVTNELWQFDLNTTNWTWLDGNNNIPVAQAINSSTLPDMYATPSGRAPGATWRVGNDLYMFSGNGFDDIWKYNTQTNNWYFVKSTLLSGQGRVFGTIGAGAPGNTPGARVGSAAWYYNNKLYLFGGVASNVYHLNDLWAYDLTTNNWAWLGGTINNDDAGVYGTLGTSAAANIPPARSNAYTLVRNNKMYMFGGEGVGYDAYHNDIWEYDPATGQWRWMKGDATRFVAGVYGTQGVANAANKPGTRAAGCGWFYNDKLYIFGGRGCNANPGPSFNSSTLGDLWEYDFATNNWRWLKGTNGTGPAQGTYNTRGVTSPSTVPGAKFALNAWSAGSRLYMFGGYGEGNGFANGGILNDLFSYNPATNNWTWLRGDGNAGTGNVYKKFGVADSINNPGPHMSGANWTVDNRLYMFGPSNLADLWYFDSCSTLACQPAPQLMLNMTSVVCSIHPVYLNAGNTGYKYQWSTGDSSQNIAVTTAGTYWVRITNPSGQIRADTAVVTTSTYPVVSLPPDTSVCVGQQIILSAGSFPGASYLWSSGATTQSISTGNAGSYVLAVNNAGCTGSDTIMLGQRAVPSFTLGPDTAYCTGHSVVLDPQYTGSGNYLWNSGAQTNALSITTAGNYSLRITDQYGCVGADTVVVNAKNSPIVLLGNDTTICSGILISLNAGSPGAGYQWSTGAQTGTIQAGSAGTYSVIVTAANGCTNADTIALTVAPAPVVTLGPDRNICSATGILLDAGNPGSNYLWSTGSQARTLLAATSGIYRVLVTNSFGCKSGDTVQLTAVASAVADSIAITAHQALLYGFAAANPRNVSTYAWNFGDGGTSTLAGPSHTYLSAGTYTVRLVVNNTNGCSDTVSRAITARTTGIAPLTLFSDIKIWPNPAVGKLIIANKSVGDILAFSIKSVDGRLVKSGGEISRNQQIQVELTDIPTGMYILQLINRSDILSYTFTIER